MKIGRKLAARLTKWILDTTVCRRQPDQVIGDRYLQRWWFIPRNPLFNVYVHVFVGSDDDRALHDHPWVSLSFILLGWYVEHMQDGRAVPRVMGDVVFRWPRAAHRIEIEKDAFAITLFVTGPKLRKWGFHCPQGWRYWRDFVDQADHGSVGRGCD